MSLQPAHLTGELTLVASRPLRDNEQPAWLTRGRLADGAPTPADLLALSNDRLRKHVLIATDTGLRLRVQAHCFARGKTDLDRSEVEDLLGRLDLLEVPSPSPVKTDALVRMLTALEKRDKDGEFTWKRGRTPYRHWVWCRQRRITLELRDRWGIASYRIDKNPDNTPAALLRRTLWRNGGQSAADFHYAADGTIRARLIHPIADMDVTELICMLRELAVIPLVMQD